MTLERRGIYLLEADDAELVSELVRNDARGRKTELLRNYAVLGHQRARKLCAELGDRDELVQALAKLFAPRGMPPDFRSAADFLRVYDAGRTEGKGGQSAQPSVVVDATAPRPASATEPGVVAEQASGSGPEPSEARPPKPTPDWSRLGGLIGKNSKGA